MIVTVNTTMKSLSLCLTVFLLPHITRSAIMDTMGRIDPIVRTPQGLVRGIQSREGDFSSFLGIPYARVNASNPFGAALPAPIFEKTFQAYEEQIACPQTNNVDYYPSTLDCLRLNIYVPDGDHSGNPLPVLVWVHGGAFGLGKAGEYYPLPLIKHGLILVAINYRLGAYGFMCLGTPEVPGNQGLKDQLAALRWIKENIAAFGGNPDKITLSGQSAGATAVNLHLYSPHEKLFHQAILQSGTALHSLSPNDESTAIRLANQLGFSTKSTELALEFLARTPPEQVTAATEQLFMSYGPCIERTGSDRFITSHPFSAPFPEKTIGIPVMLGVTSMETIGFGAFFTNSFRSGIAMRFDVNNEELDELSDIIHYFYAGDEQDDSNLVPKIEQYDTDIIQNYPLEVETTKMLEQGVGPLYNYVFRYVSENDEMGDRETMRAPHTAELKYLFSWRMNGYGNLNAEEQAISDHITALWANFVKHGNPTPSFSPLLPWPRVSGDARPFMDIGLEPSIGHRFEHANVAFWELFYEAYGDRDRILQV